MITEREKLKQQIAELQAKLDALPKKWEPKGGPFCIDARGEVNGANEWHPDFVSRGLTYETSEQAEAVSKISGMVTRLCAAEVEYGSDGRPPRVAFKKGVMGLYLSDTTIDAIERGEVEL